MRASFVAGLAMSVALYSLKCSDAFITKFMPVPRMKHALKVIAGVPFDKETFDAAQWELLNTQQTGRFVGIQTGYDPQNEEVADYMYCERSMKQSPVNDLEIEHVDSLVLGEIRSDCETCYDSERLRSRVVGTYSQGRIRSRLCKNVEVRGPGMTARGVSTEVSLRHGDGRVRILLAHAPLDVAEMEGVGKVLTAVKLSDIVIVRERLEKRPLKSDEDPDTMWVSAEEDVFDGQFKGQRSRFDMSGAMASEDMGPIPFPSCPTAEEDGDDENDGDDTPTAAGDASDGLAAIDYSQNYRRTFPGGIAVDLPWVVYSGLPSSMRVTWQPQDTDNTDAGTIYSAQIEFSALDQFIEMADGSTRVGPPRVTEFFVDTLNKC